MMLGAVQLLAGAADGATSDAGCPDIFAEKRE